MKEKILAGLAAAALCVMCISGCGTGGTDTGSGNQTTAPDMTVETEMDTETEADTDADAEIDTEAATEDDEQDKASYSVSISHGSTWEADGKKCATESIDIYNTSDSAVTDWKLDIVYSGTPEIDQIWNAEYGISDKTVTLTPVEYNKEIAGGSGINIGYNFSSDNLDYDDYILYIDGKEYRESDLSAQMTEATTEAAETTEATEAAEKAGPESGTPVDNHGALSVSGTDIVDKNGDKYQLKGVSTHGITWFPDYVNKTAFQTLRDDWGANLIRLAMYTDTGDSYGYCSGGDKDSIMALVDTGVTAATELGMYVIIDWHILNDGDPNNHIDDAKTFFDTVSAKYADSENVIYEICNEPNGGTEWSSVKSYAETIIPIIRANDKDAIIVVGTPNWSQDVDIASENPVTGYDNIMYAVHFYAASHKEELRNKVETAIGNGLPVFVSEFSICDASGNGSIDYTSADEWFKLINDNNLSYSSWSLCNKAETSALLSSDSSNTGNFADSDLSETGKYIKEKIQGN